MICLLRRDEDKRLIEQLRRHWQERFENPNANINSRYFCYESNLETPLLAVPLSAEHLSETTRCRRYRLGP